MARIVFDLDGTLIDSAPDIHNIANAVLSAEGHAPITLAQTRDFIGNGASVFVDRMRAARDIPDDHHGRLLADFVARYDDAVGLTVLYPNVETALQELIEAGHDLGVCTNKPIQPCKAVMAHLGLDLYFQTVWGGDSLPVQKPDPAPLVAAFDALPGDEKIYVGDSDVDAETAQRAMVPFFLFTEGYRKSAIADMPHSGSFSDYAELPALISRALAGCT
ncbi:MAG: phosphoglycolate phosphatase [Rhodobacteraceae bacterium CG17_big_fil_post_rev_8_21_14_2_50_65_11]|nr:MAG: phosphoglycolate phosphatase [Rhodobacteraceae bacterium CG17_big_fil_post_rev_8_21_14_2_50_65_11]